jgi:hypothetical protein
MQVVETCRWNTLASLIGHNISDFPLDSLVYVQYIAYSRSAVSAEGLLPGSWWSVHLAAIWEGCRWVPKPCPNRHRRNMAQRDATDKKRAVAVRVQRAAGTGVMTEAVQSPPDVLHGSLYYSPATSCCRGNKRGDAKVVLSS